MYLRIHWTYRLGMCNARCNVQSIYTDCLEQRFTRYEALFTNVVCLSTVCWSIWSSTTFQMMLTDLRLGVCVCVCVRTPLKTSCSLLKHYYYLSLPLKNPLCVCMHPNLLESILPFVIVWLCARHFPQCSGDSSFVSMKFPPLDLCCQFCRCTTTASPAYFDLSIH